MSVIVLNCLTISFSWNYPAEKLVNFGPNGIEHEFVNAPITRKDRTCFELSDSNYTATPTDLADLRDILVPLLRDWGTCLEASLYTQRHSCFSWVVSTVSPALIDILLNGVKLAATAATPVRHLHVLCYNFESRVPRLRTKLKAVSRSHFSRNHAVGEYWPSHRHLQNPQKNLARPLIAFYFSKCFCLQFFCLPPSCFFKFTSIYESKATSQP